MIKVTTADVAFLLDLLSEGSDLRSRLGSIKVDLAQGLDPTEIDELRDVCGERLQLTGFDEHYQPTAEGRRLELLIDRLFTG